MKVWTFILRGGSPLEMSLPGNPKLEHNGEMTVWKLCGTRNLREAAENLIAQQGCTVEVYTEEETPEQKALRAARVGLLVDDLDYDQLDDGIRHTVRVLRRNGFDTCDSGDGTKANTLGCALDIPNVHMMVSPPGDIIPEALRLREVLEEEGAEVPHGAIQATYDPCDGLALISLYDVTIPE